MQTAEIRQCQTGLKRFQNSHRSNLQTLTCLFATNRTGMFSVTGWSRNSFRTAEFSWSRSSVADESTTQTMTWIFFTNSFQYFLHNSDPPTTNKIIETIFEEVTHDHIRIESVCVCVPEDWIPHHVNFVSQIRGGPKNLGFRVCSRYFNMSRETCACEFHTDI